MKRGWSKRQVQSKQVQASQMYLNPTCPPNLVKCVNPTKSNFTQFQSQQSITSRAKVARWWWWKRRSSYLTINTQQAKPPENDRIIAPWLGWLSMLNSRCWTRSLWRSTKVPITVITERWYAQRSKRVDISALRLLTQRYNLILVHCDC